MFTLLMPLLPFPQSFSQQILWDPAFIINFIIHCCCILKQCVLQIFILQNLIIPLSLFEIFLLIFLLITCLISKVFRSTNTILWYPMITGAFILLGLSGWILDFGNIRIFGGLLVVFCGAEIFCWLFRPIVFRFCFQGCPPLLLPMLRGTGREGHLKFPFSVH